MKHVPEYRLFESGSRLMGKSLGPKDGYLAGTVVYELENGKAYWSSIKDLFIFSSNYKTILNYKKPIKNEGEVRALCAEINRYDVRDSSEWDIKKQNDLAL